MERTAFQDQSFDCDCWGCGRRNDYGLGIKSYWSGDEAVCAWQPKEFHIAGPRNVLNGGIIATLIDCHSICTAVAAAYRGEGRAMDTDPPIRFVTGALNVSYLHPTAIDRPVTLRATILEAKPKKTVLRCSVHSNEKETARGEVVAVRVPPDWNTLSLRGADE